LGDTEGCTPTPPARRGRGFLGFGEHPGLVDRSVVSSVAGGGDGVAELGLRDMQTMLQSMTDSLHHMDAMTSAARIRTLQIEASLDTSGEVLQLEDLPLPDLLEGPAEHLLLEGPSRRQGLGVQPSGSMLPVLRQSVVADAGSGFQSLSPSGPGPLAQEKGGDITLWTQGGPLEPSGVGTPLREITGRAIPAGTSHRQTVFPVGSAVGSPLAGHQVGTPRRTFGLPLPEYFSPEPSPEVKLERVGVSAYTDGPAETFVRYSEAGLGLGASEGFGLSSDQPDQTSHLLAQEEGWGTFQLEEEFFPPEDGGGYMGGALSREAGYPPMENVQTHNGSQHHGRHPVPVFVAPAFVASAFVARLCIDNIDIASPTSDFCSVGR